MWCFFSIFMRFLFLCVPCHVVVTNLHVAPLPELFVARDVVNKTSTYLLENTWAKSALNVDMTSGVVGFRRTGQDQCSVCFGGREEDCFVFSSVTCEFYMETSKLIGNEVMPPMPKQPDSPQLKAEVNSLLFSITETGQNEMKSGTIFDECIPYVSRYTNCNKENICMGCKSCECDAWGRWNCTMGRKCRPDTLHFVANHDTLVNVIESLKGSYSNTRKKRSIDKRNKSEASSFELPNVDRIHQPKVSDWTNEEPSPVINSKKDNDSIIKSYFTKIFQKPQPKLRKTKGNTKLLKYVLHTLRLLNDALPEILKMNSEEYQNNRVKRWITNPNSNVKHSKKSKKESINEYKTESASEDLHKNITFNITFEELSDWLKEVHPYVHTVKDMSTEATTPPATKEVATVDPATSGVQQQQASEMPAYLAFEEVFNNVATVPKNYTRRKPLENKSTDFNMYDDMYFMDHNPDTTTATQIEEKNGVSDTVSLFDYLEKNLENYESTTEVFVDLLKSANTNELNNDTENADLNIKIDNSMLTAVNIMKRDITSNVVNKTKPETVIPKNVTYTNTIKGLKNDVLDPIDNILKDKQKEIEELLKVRESLSNFINSHKDELNKFNTSAILSIYNLEVFPYQHLELNDLRKSTNSTLINKYLAKLKKDMFEVIRDIINIRKLYSDKKQVPPEFKYLIKAMNHYIRKTGFHPKRRKLYDVRHSKTSRRSHDLRDSSPSLVKSEIVKVLEVLDKNKPEYCALMSVSPFAQKVLKRIIKKNYIHDLAASGLRMDDPNYNFTNDLKSVGARWAIMSIQTENAPIHEKLHHMKRFQIALATDIAKVNDALALVRFIKGRRMLPVDESNGEKIVDNIHKSLQKLSKLLNRLTKKKSTKTKTTQKIPKQSSKQTKKRDSFLTQIKKMLLNSKKDILRLFKKKIPKTEIVKVIARKNIEEIKKKKLEDTMHKWQTNLNIVSKTRKKRSSLKSFDELTRRIKNIIPKYLRGKVPAMGKKNKGKKKLRGNGTAGHKSKADKTTTAHFKTKTTTKLNTVTTKVSTETTIKPTTISTKSLVTAHT